ncbi:MAG TPA: KGG domain-containing protein [Candidatus Paceibacterota bacterium]|nr:KGG domain-containing protein [Candidatus Paceibacterota bacterium]
MASNSNDGRGFAGMDPDRQRQIASKGGKAAHEKGTAHEFDSREAAEAGRRGGKASHSSDGRNNRASGRERDNQGRFE